MDEEQFHVLTTTCGTPGYMAPEIFKKTGHGKPVYVAHKTPPPPYFLPELLLTAVSATFGQSVL